MRLIGVYPASPPPGSPRVVWSCLARDLISFSFGRGSTTCSRSFLTFLNFSASSVSVLLVLRLVLFVLSHLFSVYVLSNGFGRGSVTVPAPVADLYVLLPHFRIRVLCACFLHVTFIRHIPCFY